MQMVRSSAQLQTPPWAIYFNSHYVFAHACLVQGGRALQGGYVIVCTYIRTHHTYEHDMFIHMLNVLNMNTMYVVHTASFL
jgi:hypothetical protein